MVCKFCKSFSFLETWNENLNYHVMLELKIVISLDVTFQFYFYTDKVFAVKSKRNSNESCQVSLATHLISKTKSPL